MSGTSIKTDTVWLLSGQLNVTEPSRDIPINCLPFQIGRRVDCAFSISSPTISNLHAEIVSGSDGGLNIRDMESTNGTFVNGKRLLDEVPLKVGDLVQFADLVFRVRRKSAEAATQTVAGENYDQALALIQFDKLMSDRAVVPFLQPIAQLGDGKAVGYEVLGRSNLFGLKEPKAMFQAASQLNLEAELSRMFRWEGIRCSQLLQGPPEIFLNTHPIELDEPDLLMLSLLEVRETYPQQAFTLEIHESAVTDPRRMRELRAALKDLNIGIAYDDFGAGQARLIELVDVPPDYLKFDIQLIKNIHTSSIQRQKMLQSLARMVHELGIESIAEGIECEQESKTLLDMGFRLGQGYYLGRPGPIANWREVGEQPSS